MNNDCPKISIITPTYNQGEYIEQTILSVLNQNYPNLEYIVIDGGSTDNTIDIIKKYSTKISYWISEKDRGQSDAINKGLKIATGDIVNWLNSDDYYEPDTFFKVAEAFMSSSSVSCVCGKSRLFYHSDNSTKSFHQTHVIRESLEATLLKPIIEQPSSFFSKKAIDKMGLLNEHLHYVMDKEWWIKYLLVHDVNEISQVDTTFVNFRFHKDSKTVSGSRFFYNEFANVLHALSNKLGLSDYSKLLKQQFAINPHYIFDLNISINKHKAIIERMIVYFLLKQARFIFQKKDFNFAKEVYQLVHASSYKFSEEELQFLKEIEQKVKTKNWLLYRITRILK